MRLADAAAAAAVSLIFSFPQFSLSLFLLRRVAFLRREDRADGERAVLFRSTFLFPFHWPYGCAKQQQINFNVSVT